MKKVVCILFISIYLFSTTDLKELLKINVIAQHLNEHQKNDSSVSLFSFLVMHYVTDDHNEKDNERDNQLPFKSSETFISADYSVSVINEFASHNFLGWESKTNELFFNNENFVIKSFKAIVWHPPKIS